MTQDSTTVQSHDVAHIIISRKCRTLVELSAYANISQDLIHEALQESVHDNFILILKIDVFEDYSDQNTVEGISMVQCIHTIEFLSIPYELLNTIKSNGYKNAVFYVGTSEDAQRAQVLNGPPTMDMVQTTGYDGTPRAFKSDLVCL